MAGEWLQGDLLRGTRRCTYPRTKSKASCDESFPSCGDSLGSLDECCNSKFAPFEGASCVVKIGVLSGPSNTGASEVAEPKFFGDIPELYSDGEAIGGP